MIINALRLDAINAVNMATSNSSTVDQTIIDTMSFVAKQLGHEDESEDVISSVKTAIYGCDAGDPRTVILLEFAKKYLLEII